MDNGNQVSKEFMNQNCFKAETLGIGVATLCVQKMWGPIFELGLDEHFNVKLQARKNIKHKVLKLFSIVITRYLHWLRDNHIFAFISKEEEINYHVLEWTQLVS